MDKAKAIEVLKPLVNSYVDYANITMKEEDDDIAEALEMAIDVLRQPEPQEGEWVQIQRCTGDAQPDLECPFCKHRIGWFDMGRYCAGCGAKLKGGAG